jgi:hypothetical protein
MGSESHSKPFELRITAAMDRRRAEAVALHLRRQLRQLGFDSARIVVTPRRPEARTQAVRSNLDPPSA